MSFIARENNQTIAVVPLMIEGNNHESGPGNELLYGGGPVPAPLFDSRMNEKKTNKVRKEIFNRIDEIAVSCGVSRSHFRYYDTFSNYANRYLSYNVFMKYGYNDVSLNTQIIEFKSSEKELFKNCSKGCRYEIKKSMKYLSLRLYDSSNIAPNIYADFVKFYFAVAGKETRPMESFDILYQMIIDGQAILFFAYHEGNIVGVQYNLVFKRGAYYFASAVNREFDLCSVGHYLQWNTLQYLLRHSYAYFELGIQEYHDTTHSFPSVKDKNISLFKRSFGGLTVPLFSGEKFYSKAVFEDVMLKRIHDYAKNNF
ncbi:GNAT family N-acetyltransferase [Thermodesulfobacteriota bacterium]